MAFRGRNKLHKLTHTQVSRMLGPWDLMQQYLVCSSNPTSHWDIAFNSELILVKTSDFSLKSV